MAYKDEYEVARLYTSGDFERRAASSSSKATTSCSFHLAPPLLAKKDAEGRLIKREYGPWMFTAFKLAGEAARSCAARAFDVFGHTAERKMERQLIGDYFATVDDAARRPGRRQRRARRRDRAHPGTHPRLRPRQGSAPACGEGARGGIARAVEAPKAAVATAA